MVKLLFKRIKTNQTFFTFKFLYIFFLKTKMLTGYYTKRGFKERLLKSIKIFPKKKKQKIVIMLMNEIEI